MESASNQKNRRLAKHLHPQNSRLVAQRGLLDLRILVMLCGDLENCGRNSTENFHPENFS
jgi:hypothetical protein